MHKPIPGHKPDRQLQRSLVQCVTRTAVFPTIGNGWRLAVFSRRSQIFFRLSMAKFEVSCASWQLNVQDRTRASSISTSIFFKFKVKLRTAWFQWFFALNSRAGNIIGSIIWRLCVIRLMIRSLFQRNRALSATWNGTIQWFVLFSELFCGEPNLVWAPHTNHYRIQT